MTESDFQRLSDVAHAFSGAATSYDDVSTMQRQLGQKMLLATGEPARGVVVDLGCGTGVLAQAMQEQWRCPVYALDIAAGMLKYMHQQFANDAIIPIAADAMNLPLKDRSVGVLFSNYALQWCDDFWRVLREANRVMLKGGSFSFSIPIEGTLQEMQSSWAAVDNAHHVNKFMVKEEVLNALEESGFYIKTSRTHKHVDYFDSVAAISKNLKKMGANTLKEKRSASVISKVAYGQLKSAYEVHRQELGLPVTWSSLTVVAEKVTAITSFNKQYSNVGRSAAIKISTY